MDYLSILIAGVDGSGKTTTVGKLSGLLTKISDKKIMLVAADTFRAAAIDQLKVWSEGIKCVFSNDLKDPASVVYSALDEASKQNIEILIIDTAGRLANNSNFVMLEIKNSKVY